MVHGMCRYVIAALKDGNEQVIKDTRRLAVYSKELPDTPEALCNQLFHTVYMGMRQQSSPETRGRARELAEAIGSYHVNMDIDDIYNAQRNAVVHNLHFEPKFKTEGGTNAENLALQNIQARSRMVTAYTYAQLLPTIRQRPGGGGLLVLGSANVGEALRGAYPN
jgi:NAD+ synthase (glutamine-hydrolysing)